MQSIGWYARRLHSMSVPEVLWRVGGVIRNSADRVAAGSRRKTPPMSRITNGQGSAGLMRSVIFGEHFGIIGLSRAGGGDTAMPSDVHVAAWRADAVARADAVVNHVLSFFDLQDHHLGDPIDWNYEHKAKKRAPLVFAPDIDYRDYAATGDCKFVWEPSRHHQLVTLGRAYRYTAKERYAEAALEQIESWIDQCPFGMGMNWRSPLELAIRLINWVWTLELIRSSPALSARRMERITSVVYRHLWEISRKYSRFSSANNHLIGEAAGVYIASSYFQSLKNAPRWRARSREILLREIFAQTYSDGGTREQALGYHLFVLQFFLLAALVARNDGDDFGQAYWDRLERMFEYVSAFIDGDALSPMFGDGDDGYVLDLGLNLGNPRSLMATGAVLFDRSDFKALAGEYREPAFWLLGQEGWDGWDEIDPQSAVRLGVLPNDKVRTPRKTLNGVQSRRRSCALADSGYYVLRRGRPNDADRVTVVFDCGDLGFKSIAAHGHSDALSFTLRVGGCDVLVDPGTYDYFTYDQWRDYFRSTRAHNTLVVDDANQSEMLGSFMWGRRANSRCLRWEPSQTGGIVEGEHDGYQRLTDPVTHRRTIALQGHPAEVVVTDELLSKGRHHVAMYLHFAEQCRVHPVGENRYEVDYGLGRATLQIDPALSVSVVTGSLDPILGWVSRGYHRKAPSATLVASCQCRGELLLRTRITIGEPSS